jgi:hypothetical protein
VLVLRPALRGGARNRNLTIEIKAAQEVDNDYAPEHDHEQAEMNMLFELVTIKKHPFCTFFGNLP